MNPNTSITCDLDWGGHHTLSIEWIWDLDRDALGDSLDGVARGWGWGGSMGWCVVRGGKVAEIYHTEHEARAAAGA